MRWSRMSRARSRGAATPSSFRAPRAADVLASLIAGTLTRARRRRRHEDAGGDQRDPAPRRIRARRRAAAVTRRAATKPRSPDREARSRRPLADQSPSARDLGVPGYPAATTWRGAGAAERARLEIVCGLYGPPRVRIPPSPLFLKGANLATVRASACDACTGPHSGADHWGAGFGVAWGGDAAAAGRRGSDPRGDRAPRRSARSSACIAACIGWVMLRRVSKRRTWRRSGRAVRRLCSVARLRGSSGG